MQYVVSSGTLPDITLKTGDTMSVFAQGVAVDTIIDARAEQIVFGGGVVSSSDLKEAGTLIVNAGGTSISAMASFQAGIYVYSGGVTSKTVLTGGVEFVLASGKSISTRIYSGTLVISSHALGTGTVMYGGVEDLDHGAVMVNAVIDGGVDSVQGLSTAAVIASGGTQDVFNGGVAKFTQVNNGGTEYVDVQGAAASITVNSGGELLMNNGSSSRAIINGGGKEIAGGTVRFTTLNTGASALIGGTDTDSYVASGSIETINSPRGISYGLHVASGGLEVVSSGGSADGTILAKGGYLVVLPGATVAGLTGAGTVISSGVVVDNLGLAPAIYTKPVSGLSITAPNSAFVLAGGSVTSITDDGSMGVYAGGYAQSTSVSGELIVFSGGTASGVTMAGGTVAIEAGATLDGAISFAGTGGHLVDESSVFPTNVISGFAVGDSIALSGSIQYMPGATAVVNQANVVTINDNHTFYNLNIVGATVGETDFVFSPGSVLTKAAESMTFLRPPAETNSAATPHMLFRLERETMFANPVNRDNQHILSNSEPNVPSSPWLGGQPQAGLAGPALHMFGSHGETVPRLP